MESPLLTLCVPTYNRAERLAVTLPALVRQVAADGCADRVEICISDNGSTDSTPAVVEALSRMAEVTLRSVRLERNYGYAYNFRNAVLAAGGEYVAICGDDDLIRPGGVRSMVEAIASGRDVIFFNSLPGKPSSTYPATAQIGTAEECVERLGVFHASFIGNFLVRRSVFLRHCTPDLMRSAYVHTGVLLRSLQEGAAAFFDVATVQVDDRLREWRAYQPVYTAIDMARLQTEELLLRGTPLPVVYRTYWKLIKSLPRAIVASRRGRVRPDPSNPYASLRLANVVGCYRASSTFQLLAVLLWGTSYLLPLPLLGIRNLPGLLRSASVQSKAFV